MATLEAKLIQQLISMRKTVLHSILLYLQKDYKSLERYQCLNILERYGVGSMMFCILRKNWVWLQIAAKAGGHFRTIL